MPGNEACHWNRPPASKNYGRCRGGTDLLQVPLAVAVQRLAQREPLVVVADGKLVGHAHASVQLDGLAADEPGRARSLHLRSPHGTLCAWRVVVERLQRCV